MCSISRTVHLVPYRDTPLMSMLVFSRSNTVEKFLQERSKPPLPLEEDVVGLLFAQVLNVLASRRTVPHFGWSIGPHHCIMGISKIYVI